MHYRFLADTLVLLHLAFIVFAVGGGLLALWKRWWVVPHAPTLAWALWIEFTGRICPLTPSEQALRRLAGETVYAGGFIDHYLVPIIYPAALTPTLQLTLGTFVLVFNAAVYASVWRKYRRDRRATETRSPTH